MKRATVPPAVPPKPTNTTQTTKPRTNSSPVQSPKLVRGTRAMALRQANAAAKKNDPKTSPKSPRRSLNTSVGSSSLNSPRSLSSGGGSPSSKSRHSSTASRTQSPASPASIERPGMVRQGTFTKDEPSPPSSGGKTATSAKEHSFVRSKSGIPRQATSASMRQASSISLKGTGSTHRTPPKIAPKPSLFTPRRDTVQPSSAGPKPIVATTKTQQLREKSLTRGGLRGSNSSTSSVNSKGSTVSRTSIRTSSSSHSLRTAAAGLLKFYFINLTVYY